MKKIAIICMIFCCSALNAAPYNNYVIKQTGFPDGGIVNGYFHANDLNGDGWISSDLGEVLSFSISYLGGGSIFSLLNFQRIVLYISNIRSKENLHGSEMIPMIPALSWKEFMLIIRWIYLTNITNMMQ